jgi:DNA-binding response OmpR family regulator
VTATPVLIVATDDQWLRILEVQFRLGGFAPIVRHSLVEARQVRAEDGPPRAIVLDLGPDSAPSEVTSIGAVLEETRLPMVVILPEDLADQQQLFTAAGARVVIRPYAPSQLFAALTDAIESAGLRSLPDQTPLES